MNLMLMLERDLTGSSTAASSGGTADFSPLNLLFVVLFAVFISYLAMRINRRKK